MNHYIQDLLGNILLLVVGFMMARVLPKRRWFGARMAISFVCLCICRYLYFNVVSQFVTQEVSLVYNIFGYVILLCLTASAIFACYNCGVWQALFCGSTSYCVQHIVQMIYRILSRGVFNGAHPVVFVVVYIVIALVILALIWNVLRLSKYDGILLNNKVLFFATLLMITTSIVIDLLWPGALRNNPNMIRYYFYAYSLICCILIFLLQIYSVTTKKIESELERIKQITAEEREQYKFEKSIIDLVNIRLHDLKHLYVTQEGGKETNGDIKKVLEMYDNCFETGNKTLDVVLTKKMFSCNEKEIQLTCLADGNALNFMSETDVYSMFGNILDNAIEAVEKIENTNKRVVALTVARQKNLVNIHAENYFTGKLTIVDGTIKTTKGDTIYHGFGIKSIKYIAEKYDGSIRIKTEDDRFIIDILLPAAV